MRSYNLKDFKNSDSEPSVKGIYANKRLLRIVKLVGEQLALSDNEKFTLDHVLQLYRSQTMAQIFNHDIEELQYFVKGKDGTFGEGPVASVLIPLTEYSNWRRIRELLSNDGDNPLDFYLLHWLRGVICKYHGKKGVISRCPESNGYKLEVVDPNSYQNTYLRFRYFTSEFYVILIGVKGSIGRSKRGGSGLEPPKSLDNDLGHMSELGDLTSRSSASKSFSSSAEIKLDESLLIERDYGDDYSMEF